MKTKSFSIALLAILLTTFESCKVVGGIFKAGVWTGVIMIVLVVALIIFIIARMGKK